jgi:hypothetical protein
MWIIFQIVVLIAVGGVIILGGEIDGRAIGVSTFLGLAASVVWLASSFIFSKLIELTRPMYRRRRVSGLFLFTEARQYFRGFAETRIQRRWPCRGLHHLGADAALVSADQVRLKNSWASKILYPNQRSLRGS